MKFCLLRKKTFIREASRRAALAAGVIEFTERSSTKVSSGSNAMLSIKKVIARDALALRESQLVDLQGSPRLKTIKFVLLLNTCVSEYIEIDLSNWTLQVDEWNIVR